MEGREDLAKDSLIIYQTFNPSDETLKSILRNKQEEFLDEEVYLRREKKLPPFTRLIAFIVSSNNEKKVFQKQKKIKKRVYPHSKMLKLWVP